MSSSQDELNAEQLARFKQWLENEGRQPKWYASKKLLSFSLGIFAIVLVTIAWIVADVIWHINGTIMQTAISAISALTGIHIGGQSTVDRAQAYSPYYPSGGVTYKAPTNSSGTNGGMNL